MDFLRQFMSDKRVENKYVKMGSEFGDAVSYIYMGECVGFESMLNSWGDWEQEYVNRGYRTVSLNDFIGLGGYGESISHNLGQRLEYNEEPMFHSQIYRELYLGKIKPELDTNKLIMDVEKFK